MGAAQSVRRMPVLSHVFAWSAAPSLLQRLAAACDDGTVRVFTVENTATGGKPGAHYRRSFASIGAKTLSGAQLPNRRRTASTGSGGASGDAASMLRRNPCLRVFQGGIPSHLTCGCVGASCAVCLYLTNYIDITIPWKVCSRAAWLVTGRPWNVSNI